MIKILVVEDERAISDLISDESGGCRICLHLCI